MDNHIFIRYTSVTARLSKQGMRGADFGEKYPIREMRSVNVLCKSSDSSGGFGGALKVMRAFRNTEASKISSPSTPQIKRPRNFTLPNANGTALHRNQAAM